MSKKTNGRMSKSRIYTLVVVAVLIIGGISSYLLLNSRSTGIQSERVASQTENNEKTHDAYASIPSSDIQRTGSEVDILWRPETYPVVALVHVDSIDGGRTYNPIFQQYGYPQTYGKMTVREIYRGDLKPGVQLNYSRLGGIVTYDEYWKSLNEQQQEKILHLNDGKQPAHKQYIQVKSIDDIDIKVGKDYVVFLIPQSSKDGKYHEYLIDGYQYGLREAKGSGSDITVLNNDTKKWESLSSVVRLN